MRYSKKKLKGLPTPKEYIVNNLSEYIKVLSKIGSTNYYFRGEANNYDEIISTGLRSIKEE